MKYLKYFLLCVATIFTTAVRPATIHVFYIDNDVSDVSNRDNIELLIDKVQQVWGTVPGDFILFVSNDQSPVITDNTSEFNEKLNLLYYIKPAMPFSMVDVDTLNTLISEKSTEGDEFVFHFFTNHCRYHQNNQEQLIIDRILLCNNLLKKNGLAEGCKVNVYFPEASKKKCPQINTDNKILINIRTYEIHYY